MSRWTKEIEKLWRAEKYGYSRTFTSIKGDSVRVDDIEPSQADAIGYTSANGVIHLAYDHPAMGKLNDKGRRAFRQGVATHELLHQLLTDFVITSRTANQYDLKERKIFHIISNYVEDARIENFAYQFVGGVYFKCLQFAIAWSHKTSPLLQDINDPFEQYLMAIQQLGDQGLIKGRFTFPEAQEIFRETAPIFYDAVNCTNPRKVDALERDIFRLTRPLWEKKAQQEIDDLMKRAEESGKSMHQNGPHTKATKTAEEGEGSASKKMSSTIKEISRREYEKLSEGGSGSSGKGGTTCKVRDASTAEEAREAANEAKEDAELAQRAADEARDAANEAKGTENEQMAERQAERAQRAADRAKQAAADADEHAKQAEAAKSAGNEEGEKEAAKQAGRDALRANAAMKTADNAANGASGNDTSSEGKTAQDASESARDASEAADAAEEAARKAEQEAGINSGSNSTGDAEGSESGEGNDGESNEGQSDSTGENAGESESASAESGESDGEGNPTNGPTSSNGSSNGTTSKSGKKGKTSDAEKAREAANKARAAAERAKQAADEAMKAQDSDNELGEAAKAREAARAAREAEREAAKAQRLANGVRNYIPGQLANDATLSDGYNTSDDQNSTDVTDRAMDGGVPDYSNIPDEVSESNYDDTPTDFDFETYELTDDDFASIETEVKACLEEIEKKDADIEKDNATKLPDFHIESARIGKAKTCLNRKITVGDTDKASEIYRELMKKLMPGINSLHGRLKNVFANDLEVVDKRSSGKLNHKHLNSGRLSSRVFDKRRLPSEKSNVAIVLLIDESGSMSGRKSQIAKETAIILAETFYRLDIPVYIMGFTADTGGYDAVHNHYITWRNTYNERLRLLDITARSDNFDGYSIRYGGELMKRINAEHKLMIVVSDGCPAAYAYHSGTDGIADTKDAVRTVRNTADVLGVLIGGDGLWGASVEQIKSMYDNDFIHISKIDELFDKLSRRIVHIVNKWD